MPAPEELYPRWLDDETEARRLDARRAGTRRSCDAALRRFRADDPAAGPDLLREIDALERAVEGSLAFYLRHTANDREFLRSSFGADRAREIAGRLSRRKLSLLAELDRVRELRSGVEKDRPGHEGPGGKSSVG